MSSVQLQKYKTAYTEGIGISCGWGFSEIKTVKEMYEAYR